MGNAEQKKALLLEVGAELLTRHGYNGVGLKEVLQIAKVPKGSFYHYFSSKEEYAAEVLTHYQDQILAVLDQTSNMKNMTALEKLEAITRMATDVLHAKEHKEGCLLGAMTAEMASGNEVIRCSIQQAYDKWIQRIAVLFSQAQQEGDVRQDIPAEELAEMYWDQWQGAMLRMQINADGRSLEQVYRRFLKQVYQP